MNTVTAREFRTTMNNIIETVQQSGQPITVIKNSKPWFVISPVKGDIVQGVQEIEDFGDTLKRYTADELIRDLGI